MVRGLSAIGLVMLCSGCGLTTEKQAISYHSLAGAAVLPGASAVTANVEVADARPGDQAQISAKKNMFGGTMAPIISDRPVRDVVRDAVEHELRHRGFKVGPSNLVVSINLLQFQSDYDVGFFGADSNAEVSFQVEVRAPDGRVLYTRAVEGKGLEPMNQIMNGRNARLSLEAALSDAMRELTADPTFFDALTERGTPAV